MNLERRVVALEALPVCASTTAASALTLEQRAAHFGLAEADVVRLHGGWPGFAHANIVGGQYATAEERHALDAEVAADIAKYGSAATAYFAMLKADRARARP